MKLADSLLSLRDCRNYRTLPTHRKNACHRRSSAMNLPKNWHLAHKSIIGRSYSLSWRFQLVAVTALALWGSIPLLHGDQVAAQEPKPPLVLDADATRSLFGKPDDGVQYPVVLFRKLDDKNFKKTDCEDALVVVEINFPVAVS